ncbi:hypothetical protein LSTR_LSTR016763 [Laodelphax striatellus]|uniref:TGF-beta propeptide domain-containing protein n=1 Tax=Laodelphax striatellus TaxID=195883 RepID=A0A482X4L0_LAOST|nr:hypothetical protein LSTR_LSTR016763 [Laodelphax striatellus]
MVVRVGRLLWLWLLLWPAAGGDNVTSAAKCGPCQRHEELRNISLAHIKMQVLEKLGLKHPPNVTGRSRDLHDKPQLRQLMSMYGLAAARERDRDRESPQLHTPGMLGDQPEQQQQQQQPFRPMQPDDDDDHAKTERIFAFPQQREFHTSISN